MVIFPCFVQCFDTLALVTGWAFGLYGISNKPATDITSGFFRNWPNNYTFLHFVLNWIELVECCLIFNGLVLFVMH